MPAVNTTGDLKRQRRAVLRTQQNYFRSWGNRLIASTRLAITSHKTAQRRLARVHSPLFIGSPFLVLRQNKTFFSVLRLKGRWLFTFKLSQWGGRLAIGQTTLSTWNWSKHFQKWVFAFQQALGALKLFKLRYKGKSFKWHRRRGSLMLRFGHSHLVTLRPLPGIRWRRHGRMKILLFGSNGWDLRFFATMACRWRPMNIYHGRGLRLARQWVWRKAGKVSAYR